MSAVPGEADPRPREEEDTAGGSSGIWNQHRLSGEAWCLKLLKSEFESYQELPFPDFDTGQSSSS